MRLNVLHDSDHYLAYHVTDSFHIVKLIFNIGFKAETGSGRVSLGYKPWSDFGMYIIEVEAIKDEWYDRHGPETGALPEHVKPVKWGFIFSDDNITWVNNNPNAVTIDDFDQLVKQNANQWQLYNWEKDRKASDSQRRSEEAILGRGYNYEITKYDEHTAKHVLQLLTKFSLVEAFRRSGLPLSEFKDYIHFLMARGKYSWGDSPDETQE